MEQPILSVTLGDPAGIGPETVVRTCLDSRVTSICKPLIIGDAEIIRRACRLTGADNVVVKELIDPGEAEWANHVLNVRDLRNVRSVKFRPGIATEMCGKAAYKYILAAADLTMSGVTAAMVTAPINKESIHLAGVNEPGHAEILANYTQTKDFAGMLVDGSLRVVHMSTHVSLRKAIELVTKDRVMQVIRLAHRSLQQLGFPHPRIAVAGLNPHCGEGGLFGDEELHEIIPAIRNAQQDGIDVNGPIPGDTVFVKARGGLYDVVIAMYHDQGHIPIKDGAFRLRGTGGEVSGVNVTIGLPIIRTSVDHGTAFDIAWQGKADPTSLIAAIQLAVGFISQQGSEK
ncbi:MAG: 4-hydroxythreonine-4-phosphate dehydrogenase PdxA [bacterium]|nr:4-hydroxythreonine-4-phosphate dehydrogenase PdxA [bacterium]